MDFEGERGRIAAKEKASGIRYFEMKDVQLECQAKQLQ